MPPPVCRLRPLRVAHLVGQLRTGGMERLLVEFARHADRRRFDLIRDYALPLPATVIAEILGVPAVDRHRFHRWSAAIVTLSWSKWDMLKSIPAVWHFLRYTRKLVQCRRAAPGRA